MSTFTEFIQKCNDRIENKNTRTTPYLKEGTVRWLKEVSGIRALFMESTFSFATTAGTAEYGPGYTGFPVDAMEFHAVYREVGSGSSATRELLSGPMPITDIRSIAYPGVGSGTPEAWAWHHDKMIFSPLVSQVVTISGDYFKDATRDSSSGTLIASTSTTHTNPWFERGEQALLNAVLMDYYAGIGKDVEAATLCERLYEKAIETIRRDVVLKSLSSAQADWCYG